MKRLILSILVLFVGALSWGRRVPYSPLYNSAANVLERPAGNSPAFDLFLRKLDTLVNTGGGNVRVLQVGGSHVQGGSFSNRLRRDFLSLRYGMDGGRGLVFPYSAAMTNTPSGYSSSFTGNWEGFNCLKNQELELGITGIAVVARDTSARVVVDLLPRENRVMQHRYTFRSVDVLGEGDMEPVLLLQGRDTLRGSALEGRFHFDLPYYVDWLNLAFEGRGRFVLRGMYLDKPGNGFTYSEAGINGASTQSWLRCALWEEDLKLLNPDLVIFSIGINDIQGADFDVARFKSRYRELMYKVRRVNPYCAILFTGINDSWYKGKRVNEHTQAVQDAMRELAHECAGVFWDWFGIMGGYDSMSKWQEAGLAQPDKVHFTPSGYALLADLLFDAIMDCYSPASPYVNPSSEGRGIYIR